MFRITPYNTNSPKRRRDVFDVFDEFFNERNYYSRDFNIDVRDTGDTYIIDADLPGIKKEEINVHFEDERLVISVNREEEKEEEKEEENYIHKERRQESYERSLHLKDVDPKKFKAKLDSGVLTITAPKLEEKVNKYLIDIE